MKKQVITCFILLIFIMLAMLTASWMSLFPSRRSGSPGSAAAAAEAAHEAVNGGVSPGPEPSEEPEPSSPAFDRSDWRLKLVNGTHELEADYEVVTAEAENGYLFDERAVDDLLAMLEAGRAEGVDLLITSAWRAYGYQAELYENKVQRVMAEQGCGRGEAETIAAEEVAVPGSSEHCLGLAVDIITSTYTTLDYGFSQTDAARWLAENCADYGFILRYPEGKEDITGKVYEPWHFRYVGAEAAEYIMENGLTLEEFLDNA